MNYGQNPRFPNRGDYLPRVRTYGTAGGLLACARDARARSSQERGAQARPAGPAVAPPRPP
eukprot:6280099-Alexandrium_andersonii.AAC.1